MKKFLIGLVAAFVSAAAIAGFIDERSKAAETGSAEKAGVAAAAAPEAPKVDLSLTLRPGDLFSERLVEWAKRNGYTLTWDAPEYRSGGDLVLSEDFDKSLDLFLGSMRLNKVRLEAEIYANKAVRIIEVK